MSTTTWRCLASSWRATRLTVRLSSPPFSTALRHSSSAAATAARQDLDPGAMAMPLDTPPSPQTERQPFHTLRERLTRETLDAITVRPFKLTHMTSVQEEVLGMLPDLSEPYHESRKDELRDLLVRAKTGTGKTLAFLVPAIESRIKAIEKAGDGLSGLEADVARRRFARDSVGTLIISPTRELATQIANEALRLSHHHKGFEVRLFTGGTSKVRQVRDWMKGRRDIVVATTGRLRDLLSTEPDIERGVRQTKMLVLDEADTMLDMGFQDDIAAILKYLPPSPIRQTFLFSATVSPKIRQVARKSLHENHRYINTITEEDSPVHAHIPQYSTVLPSAAHQIPYIMRLIAHDQLTNMASAKEGGSKVIVFLPTTKMTQLFATIMRELSRDVLPAGKNTKVYEIHSKRAQESRINTSDAFRAEKGSYSVLVTSDVSARGVDYPGVTRVIQVGIPSSSEQYIHRIGRTGRAGKITGRGDIVLLPWEVGFLTWQLTDVPLKAITTSELEKEITSLAKDLDTKGPKDYFLTQHPDAAKSDSSSSPRTQFDSRGRPINPWDLFPKSQIPYLPLVETFNSAAENLLNRLDEEAVRETFLSLIGYYISKTPELRVQKDVVVAGCRAWTTEGMGLKEAPFVSQQFLAKLGYNDGRTKKFGTGASRSTFGLGRDREGPGQSRWSGRGSQRLKTPDVASRKERDQFERYSAYDDADEDSEGRASEYRSQRYGKYSGGNTQQNYGAQRFGSSDRPQRFGSSDRDRQSRFSSGGGYRKRDDDDGSYGFSSSRR